MDCCILVLVLIHLAVLGAGDFPRHYQLQEYTFASFVRDANRPYSVGSDEWRHREKVFNARLDDIKRHNAEALNTYKRGINQFADWTSEEFLSYNRASGDRDQPAKPHTKQGKVHVPLTDLATSNPLPKYVDYRLRVNPSILTAVKNQGCCGSCWSTTATECIESYFALRYGQLPVLSVQQVTSCTKGSSGCRGGFYHLAWEEVSSWGGLNEEFVYPYVDFFSPQRVRNDTQQCLNITERFPIVEGVGRFTWWPKANVTEWRYVRHNDAHAVMDALARVGPLAVSVAASHQWSDYESGVLQNNFSRDGNWSWQRLNHDTQLVGYGFDVDLGMNYWIVRNSWGTNYGEQGYIRLSRPDVEPCGNLTGRLICGTSGVLSYPGYPIVAALAKDKWNGHYF